MTAERTTNIFWVGPGRDGPQTGTREQPYADISAALARVQPGETVMLLPGTYRGDITIELSGTREKPIRITTETPGAAIIEKSCWYLYDTADISLDGLTFRDSPASALSAVGACCRNSFSNLRFENCSRGKRPACTMFLGGSGSECNVVERCSFIHDQPERAEDISAERASVALMVSQGDADGGDINRAFVFRSNTIVNYGYGIMVGTRDGDGDQYGHVLERNVLQNCGGDAITVKCGDTTVRDNRVSGSAQNGIRIAAGSASTIEHNRITACGVGVRVHGPGHTIARNCIAECPNGAITITRAHEDCADTTAVLVIRNTIVDCGRNATGPGGIDQGQGTCCVAANNLFSGVREPYRPALTQDSAEQPVSFFSDNFATGDVLAQGCRTGSVAFTDPAEADYASDSSYGTDGWVLSPGEPPEEQPDSEYSQQLAESAEQSELARKQAHELLDEDDSEEAHALSEGFFFPELPDGTHPADE